MIVTLKFPDYYSEAVQKDIVAAIYSDGQAVIFDLVIERIWDATKSEFEEVVRPIDSDPVQPDRPHLSFRAPASARPIGDSMWLIACDHAYISGAHIVIDSDTLDVFSAAK